MRVKNSIKEYCLLFGYKFEKMISEKEFITSKKVGVFAGMEYLPGTNKFITIPIRKIGFKIVYEKHLCFNDGDIISNGITNNL
jgi:hypothetical protein